MRSAFPFPGTEQHSMKQSIPEISMEGVKAWLRENLLLVATFSGVIGGFILGLGLRPLELEKDTILLLAYPGELFMRLLKLMILPLVIASLITGAASLNAKMNGMMALRTIIFFMVTSLLAACVGLVLVIAVHPGTPEMKAVVGDGVQEERKIDILDNFLDLGRNVVPNNLFQATFQTAGTKYEETLRGNSTTYEKILFYRSFKSTAMLHPTMGLKILFVSNAGSSYLSLGLVQTPWASSSSV